MSFNKKRGDPEDLYKLEDALGPHGAEIVKGILSTGQLTFHAAGDSGAFNAGKYKNEIRVADQLTMDCNRSDPKKRPMFFYHLGDVVYNFGESQFYFDQFYDPFRNYPGPIFAIPGNHDTFVVPGRPEDPITVFTRNFCAEAPDITPEAASLHRTAMTQPGVYFTLDAPFVRIIGLFSNALEDPGVISSGARFNNGKVRWDKISDDQLTYLEAQLKRIKKEEYRGVVLLATHHLRSAIRRQLMVMGEGGTTAAVRKCCSRSIPFVKMSESIPTLSFPAMRIITNAIPARCNYQVKKIRTMCPSSFVATVVTMSTRWSGQNVVNPLMNRQTVRKWTTWKQKNRA